MAFRRAGIELNSIQSDERGALFPESSPCVPCTDFRPVLAGDVLSPDDNLSSFFVFQLLFLFFSFFKLVVDFSNSYGYADTDCRKRREWCYPERPTSRTDSPPPFISGDDCKQIWQPYLGRNDDVHDYVNYQVRFVFELSPSPLKRCNKLCFKPFKKNES